jgi:hypothetical protein
MDEHKPPFQNPFTPPSALDEPLVRSGPKPIHPLLIVVLVLASMGVGGCVFFCSCLGAVMFSYPNSAAWILWLCGAAALAAAVGTFYGIVKLIRRSQRKSALYANRAAASNIADTESNED